MEDVYAIIKIDLKPTTYPGYTVDYAYYLCKAVHTKRDRWFWAVHTRLGLKDSCEVPNRIEYNGKLLPLIVNDGKYIRSDITVEQLSLFDQTDTIKEMAMRIALGV